MNLIIKSPYTNSCTLVLFIRNESVKPHRHTVYGCATDGMQYHFAMITREREVKSSRVFNIRESDLRRILGIVKDLLQITLEQTPNNTPQKPSTSTGADVNTDVYGSAVDVEDSFYFKPPSKYDERDSAARYH
jgi:hypothetical protein